MLLLYVVACTLALETLSDPDEAGAAGADWVDLGDPLTAVTVDASADGGCEAWATSGSGSLLHSNDEGRTWEVLVAGDGSNELSGVARLPGEVWAVGRRGRVVRVTASGVEDHSDGTQDLTDVTLARTGDGAVRAWLAGREGTVRHTPDAGVSWDRRGPDTQADLFAIAATRPAAGAREVTLWAGGAGGGLWSSSDGGALWTPERVEREGKDADYQGDILALSFSPSGVGWAAGADGSILTRQPGNTWTLEKLPGSRARLYAVKPLKHLLTGALEAVVAGHGSLFTRAVGEDWTEATWKGAGPRTAWNGIGAAENCLLAVGDDGAVAAAEVRPGEETVPRWSVVRSGWRPGFNALSVAEDGDARDGLAVGRAGTAFRLREERWELVDIGATTNLLGADLHSPGNGWVVGLGALIRLRGDTWNRLSLPPELGAEPAIVGVDSVDSSSAWAFSRAGALLYAADLLEPRVVSGIEHGNVTAGCYAGNAVILATTSGIRRYLIDRAEWDAPAWPGPDSPIVRALRCDREGRAWMAASVPGASRGAQWGVYESGDAGLTWSLTAGQQRSDLFGLAVDEVSGVAVGALGTALVSEDGWETARPVLGALDDVYEGMQGVPRLRAADLAGGNAWAVGDSLAMLQATRGGAWSDVSPSYRAIIATKDETLVVTDGSWLLSSRDGGRSWQPQAGCGVMGIRAGVALANKAVVLVGEAGAVVVRKGAAGAVFRGTVDGGFTAVEWPKKSARPTVDLNDIAAGSDDSVWIVGDDGVLLRGTANGLTMEPVPTGASERDPPLRDDLRGVRAANGSMWIVGEHGVVLQSTGGSVWRQRRLPVTEDLEDIVLDGEVGWVVGSRGAILETRDGGHAWEDVSGNSRAHLRAVAVGGALGEGGLIVGDGATLLQAHRVDPPPDVESDGAVRTPSAITWDLRWVGDPAASMRYRASTMHLRASGAPWQEVAFTSESTGAGLRLVVPDSLLERDFHFDAGSAFQARVTLTDGRRSWDVLLAESSWQTWLEATPEYLQIALGFLLIPGFGLGMVWLVRPQALLRASSEEEAGTLQGIIQGISRFLGPWAAPVTMLLTFMVPLQRTARVRDAWLKLYRAGAYHLNAIRPSTFSWYLKAPEVQRAIVARYQADAFLEVQRALGVDPTEGVLRPPATVNGRGVSNAHLAIFREPRLRSGLVHIRASSVEGAPEYLFATALLACEGGTVGPVGAIPIMVHDEDKDILNAVNTALHGLFDESDREAVTPALTTELVGLGCVIVLFTAPTVPEHLLSDIRAIRRGWPKSLVLLAAEDLGSGGADIKVDATVWPLDRALSAVDIVLEGENEEERARVRALVRASLLDGLGATPDEVDLPPRLVDALVRRAHDSQGESPDLLSADAVTTWLLEALRAPPTQAAAWLDAACRFARISWDPQTDRLRPFRFDASVQRDVGVASGDVLGAAARIGILVGAVHHGRFEWEFRHSAVARVLARHGSGA